MYRDFEHKLENKNKVIDVDNIIINDESQQILKKLLEEISVLSVFFSHPIDEAKSMLRQWVYEYLNNNSAARDYYNEDTTGSDQLSKLSWQDYAAIRILDYLDHDNQKIKDQNLQGKIIANNPFRVLGLAIREQRGGGTPDFFRDMLHLFRQFNGTEEKEIPNRETIQKWMDRHPSGLDPLVIEQRKKNRDRIIRLFIKKIDSGDIDRRKFRFEPGMTFWQKYKKVMEWWNDRTFHLQFAARTPERLNRMLGRSLSDEEMNTLLKAQDSGIPFFVNPYYLSLINVDEPEALKNTDHAIRDYMMVSKELVEEFGKIVAWEKEDIVEPGKPNAAGWILPNRRNIHRRYPEVAILIPDTTGRACGGLCVSCQRMYDFQDGHLNFDLEELKPVETWWERLPKLLKYYEKDSQLRDILITGGDALMSSDNSLKRILDEVYKFAVRKREANKYRAEGEKYAEMQRIRLGSRLPVYLPQRITNELVAILSEFKSKAQQIGFKQFVIQTHFESAMEVTPEAAEAIRKLLSAGWTVTNQVVFTAAASRRGHIAKLRKVLNDIGVLTYYTFTVKGFKENSHQFANNARAVQEQAEEKHIGEIPEEYSELIKSFSEDAEEMVENIESLRSVAKIPFLATDRNVMNLPGVGKSLTFRTIGITHDGRRILLFNHDPKRNHSPIVDTMGKVIIIESRSIGGYLRRLESMGENMNEYQNIWGYSIGETKSRMSVFDYPEQPNQITSDYTNLEI